MPQQDAPALKDEKTYQALRDDGYSKEAAARISNAKANESMHPSKKGGTSPSYEDWTKEDLYDRAQELGIESRSDMTKAELVSALRNR